VEAIDLMKRHNNVISTYVSKADSSLLASEDLAQKSRDEISVSENDMDGGNPGRAKRKRREKTLGKLVEEGKELRNHALSVIRWGGADAYRAAVAAASLENTATTLNKTNVKDSSAMQFDASSDVSGSEVSATGRRVLLLLHGLLSARLDGSDIDSSLKQQARTMRNMLEQMHDTSAQANALAPQAHPRKNNDAGGDAERRARRRERVWKTHVTMYNSLSGSDEPKRIDEQERMERYVEQTMAMLRSSGGWLGGPPPGSDEETLLEDRLRELQSKNKHMARQATGNLGYGTGYVSATDDSDVDVVGTYFSRQGRGRVRRRRAGKKVRMAKAYGLRKDAFGSPIRGYAGDASGQDTDHARSWSPVRLLQKMPFPGDKRMPTGTAGMRRAHPLQGSSDVAWMDHVLPSATEASDDYDSSSMLAPDDAFWQSPLAKQLLSVMASFKESERAKHEEIVRREAALEKVEGRLSRAHASVENVSVVQERIFNQVHKIRREVTTKVRDMFKRISSAREKLQQARNQEDEDVSKLIVQEAQRELLNVEAEALELRKKMRKSTSIRVDFMPAYLQDFLTKDLSAQAMFDQGRLRQLQAKAMEEEKEEMRRLERMERKREGVPTKEQGEVVVITTPALTPEEQELLDACKEDARQLCKVVRIAYVKSEEAAAAANTDVQKALDAAMASERMLEQALIMSKHLKKKMRGQRAKNLKRFLPSYLKNLKDISTTPLMDAWKTGVIEPNVCEAVDGVDSVNKQIQLARDILVKLDRAEEITDAEAEQAQMLLENAVVVSVEIRERARASMLDPSIGGSGVEFWQFPKHVQNMIASDESVIILWEKGLTDATVCSWVQRIDEANALIRQSLKHEERATELGECPEGLDELQQMDVLQYRADRMAEDIRAEMKQFMNRGMQMSRLPPHLQNLVKDDRPLMMLFREGKTDPIMAVMEHRAEVMLKNKQKIDAMLRKGKKLLDEENRKRAMQQAMDMNEANMKEMLKLRAKMMMGGIGKDQLKGALARVIEEAEDGMRDEGGRERAKTAMMELGAELGADEELMARIAELAEKTIKRQIDFVPVDWDSLVGKYAESMTAPEPFPGASGIDCSIVPPCPRPEPPISFPNDPKLGLTAGADISEISLFTLMEPVDRSLPAGYTNIPVFDDLHKKFPDGVAAPIFEDSEDEDHVGEYGVSATEQEDDGLDETGMPRRKDPKEYDSDNEQEVVKLDRKKKKAETVKTRVQGKTRIGVPLEVRRAITKGIVAAKRTLKLDISNLKLPYIPKQVMLASCIHHASM
jgi:hypothetical protein